MLIKFFDNEKWAKHLLRSGEMRFTETTCFRKFEDKNLRKDELEGFNRWKVHMDLSKIDEDIPFVAPNGDTTHYLLTSGVKKDLQNIGLTDFSNLNLRMEVITENYIYCMVYLPNNVPIKSKIIHEIRQFGEWCVVFHNEGEIYNRLRKRTKNTVNNIYAGKIKYLNSEEFSNIEYIDVFNKIDRYKNQSEYRFSIKPKNTCGEIITVHIGNCEDIASIYKFDDFFTPIWPDATKEEE